MKRLKISLITSCAFLLTSTTVCLLEAQAARVANNSTNTASTPSDVKQRSSNSSDSSSWFGAFQAGERRTLTIKGVKFAFRYCPAGTFTMGSPEDEEGRYSDEAQHKVTLSEGFWIQETELTQNQWDVLGVKTKDVYLFRGADLPVDNVSWEECNEYVDELNKSGAAPQGLKFCLPTEEQWEYACRAGTTGATCGTTLDKSAWRCPNSEDRTHEVGTKAPNAWGLYDMLGNVWEWTCTRYDGASFVLRGGSWYYVAQYCRPAFRSYNGAAHWYVGLEFRMVLVSNR